MNDSLVLIQSCDMIMRLLQVVKILKGRYPPVPTRYCSSLRGLVDSMLRQNPKVGREVGPPSLTYRVVCSPHIHALSAPVLLQAFIWSSWLVLPAFSASLILLPLVMPPSLTLP
jgi:hypothetical protein